MKVFVYYDYDPKKIKVFSSLEKAQKWANDKWGKYPDVDLKEWRQVDNGLELHGGLATILMTEMDEIEEVKTDREEVWKGFILYDEETEMKFLEELREIE